MYAYCLNNPANMVDYGGNKPGDLFDTPDEAARDFAEYINAKSIADNREYASYVYKVKVTTSVAITVPISKIFKLSFLPEWLTITIKGNITKTKYTYAEPKKGTKAGVVIPIISYALVSNKVALLHTHGKYLEDYGSGNDHFSPDDKWIARFFSIPFYVATPLGTLRKYDPLTESDVQLFDDLPYDKSHPRR